MTDRHPSDPYFGALLGLACGDALGAPVEFMSREAVEQQHGRLTEMVGGGQCDWAPGEWTDDTGMALCIAEGILAQPGDPVPEVGRRFIEWRADAKDVGGTIAAAISNAETHNEGGRRGWLNRHGSSTIDWPEASRTTPQARNHKAAGNGSLMRTLPVTLAYPGVKQMLDVSARISAMTHWDPQAEICCAAYCLWVREMLLGVDPRPAWETALSQAREIADEGKRSSDTTGPAPLPDGFWSRLAGAPDRELEELQPTGYAGYVLDCLEAAVWAAVHTDSLETALVALVNLGGETDTMAAVAGGAVGARFGRQAIPQRWLEVLHQRQRLEQAARDLFDMRDQLVYSKPTLPELGLRQIDGGLFCGRNPLTAKDVERMLAAGVTQVLDLREDHEWSKPGRFGREAVAALDWCGVPRASIAVVDGNAPSSEQLDHTWQVLSDGLDDGSVYVHCRAGIERTGAVIAAYLARRDGLSFDDTLRRLNETNAGLYPLSFQAEIVRGWLRTVQ